MLTHAFIGLGTNLGPRKYNLKTAYELINAVSGIRIATVSSIYYTQPLGLKTQPWFANQVMKVECSRDITPENLLDILLGLERQMGRDRAGAVKLGPRIIDLDLLLYEDKIINSSKLTIPHPEMKQRAFVLVPLQEIHPDCIFPDGESVGQAISKIRFQKRKHVLWQN